MYISAITLFALMATSIAAPEHNQKRGNEKRQDINQLLGLASLAGITALPTDPAVLLSLGPLASSLAAVLPTSSVLSVLETAAPSTFIRGVLYTPSYASSFLSDFSAGNSPSWFNALPTDVKSYLHTYSDYGAVATAVGQFAEATRNASLAAESSAANSTHGGSGTGTVTSTSGSSTAMSSTAGSGSGASAAGASTTGSSSANASGASTAGAPSPTGAIAAGLAGVVGILGLAVAL